MLRAVVITAMLWNVMEALLNRIDVDSADSP